jgi:glycosyltransferase involved in cell wall biosynthesis
MNIVHVITGLGKGGAEGSLYRLIKNDSSSNIHTVISMMDFGYYGNKLLRHGVKVHILNFPRGSVKFKSLIKIFLVIKSTKPDVVQTWMYHADLLGGIVAKILRVKNILWGVRHSNIEKGKISKFTRIIVRLCKMTSGFVPDKIVYNSKKSSEVHSDFGYNIKKLIVIPNGYNIEKYTISHSKLIQNKKKTIINIGMVARWNIQKDHHNLFQAMQIIDNTQKYEWKLILAGSQMDGNNHYLMDMLDRFNIQNKVELLGELMDIDTIYKQIDLHILSSIGESFPNVVAESMLSGIPNIVTDVGDSKYIVGDVGWLVPTSDHKTLALNIDGALQEFFNNREKWIDRCKTSRKFISQNFSIEKTLNQYQNIWHV